MGSVAGTSTLLWLLVGRERVTTEYTRSLESQVRSPLLNVLRYKEMWLLGLAMGSATIPVISFEVFWPTFAKEELNVSLGIAGFTAGIVMLVGGPAGIMVNTVPWLARRQPLLLGISGVAVISTGAALLHLHWVPALLLVAVPRGMVHVYFPAINIMVYQLRGATPREVAAGIAVVSTAAWAGAAVGPLMVGFVQEATDDRRLALYTTVFFPALGIIAAAVLHILQSRASLPAPAARTS
jgi:cyanate permease